MAVPVRIVTRSVPRPSGRALGVTDCDEEIPPGQIYLWVCLRAFSLRRGLRVVLCSGREEDQLVARSDFGGRWDRLWISLVALESYGRKQEEGGRVSQVCPPNQRAALDAAMTHLLNTAYHWRRASERGR